VAAFGLVEQVGRLVEASLRMPDERQGDAPSIRMLWQAGTLSELRRQVEVAPRLGEITPLVMERGQAVMHVGPTTWWRG
jgi:hypothetical protein